jgi:hypothetical protein
MFGMSKYHCIGIKKEFETNLKFFFAAYNTKNKILRLNILFIGYIFEKKQNK